MNKFNFTRACVATQAAQAACPDARMRQLLHRHFEGDWGELSDADVQANEYALKRGGDKLMSAFRIDQSKSYAGDNRVWIITDADRETTTVLLPEDY